MWKKDKGGGVMERLTRCVGYLNENKIYKTNIDMRRIGAVDELKNALGKYEDLEEQGLLLRLPCKVGDTIYEVSYENREFVIKEHIVKEFIYRAYRFPRIEIYCENENGFLACNNIGKLDECLFLTKAEAEQKLKELRGGENDG